MKRRRIEAMLNQPNLKFQVEIENKGSGLK